MRISKIFTATLLCLLIISCGDSGKSKKREPSRKEKRKIEILEKQKAIADEEKKEEKQLRNNGNYRKPTQRDIGESKLRRKTTDKAVTKPEEDPAKISAARIEKRVRLELDIWKAKERKDNTTVRKLREEADNLAKEMTQAELDEAYKKLKDLKKRM